MLSCKLFTAEDFSFATHGRVSLQALNFTHTITAPAFPYRLVTRYICLLDVPTGGVVANAKFSLQFNEGEPLTLDVPPSTLGPREKPGGAFYAWPTEILLPSQGTLSLTFSCDGFTHTNSWAVEAGPGALRADIADVPARAVIDGRKSWDPLVHLKREIRSKVIIADPYLTPEFLRRFLGESTKGWTVQIITNEDNFKDLSPNDTDLKVTHPHVEVRFDGLFHDRLICRDDEEIYTFGASLKDTTNGRVSFFQRLYDQQQTTQCIRLLEESWGKAKPR